MYTETAAWKLQYEINKIDPGMPADPRLVALADVSSIQYQEAVYKVQHKVMSPYEAACLVVNSASRSPENDTDGETA